MMDLLTQIMNMQTNELIVSFVVNNIVLLGLIKIVISYITRKTKSKADDDLPGLLDKMLGFVQKRPVTKDFEK